MWQDYILTAANSAFCLTLTPMLRRTEKPPYLSSITTGVLLLTVAAIMATLHLWFAAASRAIVGI